MSETLEDHEKAKEAAEGGRRWSALLIAALAAGLAFSEQGAQHAQTQMSADAIAATDLWAQYQAKSIRANEAKDLASLAQVVAPAGHAMSWWPSCRATPAISKPKKVPARRRSPPMPRRTRNRATRRMSGWRRMTMPPRRCSLVLFW